MALSLIVFLTAVVAASGFLRAWLRFCAGFGWLSGFNFDEVGTTSRSLSARSGSRPRDGDPDRPASALVGAVVALVAVALPV